MYDDLKRKQGYQKSFTFGHLIISIFYIYPQMLLIFIIFIFELLDISFENEVVYGSKNIILYLETLFD